MFQLQRFASLIAVAVGSATALGQSAGLSTLGLSTLSSPPQTTQARTTDPSRTVNVLDPDADTEYEDVRIPPKETRYSSNAPAPLPSPIVLDDNDDLLPELITDCLREWELLWRTGQFKNAQVVAEKAAQLDPRNLAVQRACFFSRVMNALRTATCTDCEKGSCVTGGCETECCPVQQASAKATAKSCACCEKGCGTGSKDCACAPRGQAQAAGFGMMPNMRTVHGNVIVIPTVRVMTAGSERRMVGWAGVPMMPPPPPPPIPGTTNALPPAFGGFAMPCPVQACPVQTVARSEEGDAGSVMHVAAGEYRVLLATPNLDAECQRMTFVGTKDRVLLEGKVRLTCRKEGQTSKIEANRVLVDLVRGTFTVETGAGLPPVPPVPVQRPLDDELPLPGEEVSQPTPTTAPAASGLPTRFEWVVPRAVNPSPRPAGLRAN